MRRWGVLLSFLLTVPWAMAEEKVVYPQQGVQRFLGLDDTSAPTQVEDGRAQDLQNVLLSSSGDLRQRYGVDVVLTPDSTNGLQAGDILDIPDEDFCAVTGVYYTKFSSGTERIVATCGSRFYYLNGTASWDEVTRAASSPITAGQNNQFVFTTALDNIIATNDVNPPLQYDGTTLSQVSFTGLAASETPSAAKTVAFFKNFLVFGNTVENSVERPTRIRYSNVGTINTWSDNDFVDIGALGGQEINCMAELYDTLIVGLTSSLYKISYVGGADTFQVSKITDSHGCIAKNSMQPVVLANGQHGLMFLDTDKEVNFFNGVVVVSMTGLIDTVMDGLSGSRLQYAVSALTPTDYWLCTTSGTGSTNNLCLDFQYDIGEWTKHTNIPANAMGRVIDNNSNDEVYWGSYKSLVYQLEDTSERDDVHSFTGTVSVTNPFTTATASGLTVLYNAAWNLTTGSLVGAPLEVTGGTGITQTNTVIHNTNTGIVVTDTFSTTLDSTSNFEIGAIDSFYTTKWYDFQDPARLKHWLEVYFWAEADVSSTHTLAWADDYSTDISTRSTSLSSSSSDSIWGSAIWGTALWGDVDDIFRAEPISGEGRYFRLKWSEDDPAETFHVYGWNLLFAPGEVN